MPGFDKGKGGQQMNDSVRDFREYLSLLDDRGLLVRVRRAINKDTEMVPLVRLQFRGLPADQRRAFLFENVTDSRGRSFAASVAIGAFAASREVYSAALGTSADGIAARWKQALSASIDPVKVTTGPCKEMVVAGDELESTGGVDMFPHPISTPGFDPAPFLTAPCWVTRDVDTGTYNVGTYRAMVKGPRRLGLQVDTPSQHIAIHLEKARKRGRKLQAAVVLGAVPAVGLASVQKIPYGASEYSLAGGLLQAPLEVVACETVDLEVPARAEIVIEGSIDPGLVEPEGPFGEASGYMGPTTWSPSLEITCITYRHDPIVQAFISEFPPSESTLMRKIGFESVYRNFLRHNCNIDSVRRVSFYESGTCNMMFVISLDSPSAGQAWQALYAASGYEPSMGKIIVAVDDDVDPGDFDAVIWALSFRMQPLQDIRILGGKVPRLDPSADTSGGAGSSAVLIDATRAGPYPPTSLPSREHMEHALEIWKELGLSELSLRHPWYGYELGAWTQRNRDEAAVGLRGRYVETGTRQAERARHIDDL
ncbi:MAG: UbiD family decarboxylase [Sciscionella sp.]